MAYLTVVAMTRGRKAALWLVAGIACGLLAIGLAAIFGLAALIDQFPLLYDALRIAGVFYLLWLAYDNWRDSIESAPQNLNDISSWQYFRQGFVTNVLNPKAALFYLATLPEFIVRSGPRADIFQTTALTLVYIAIATSVHLILALAGARAYSLMSSTGRMKLIRRLMALSLGGVAVWLVFTTAR